VKFGTMSFLTTLILSSVLTIPVRLAAQSSSSEVTTFDAPGAGTAAGSGFGTFPTSRNDGGTITRDSRTRKPHCGSTRVWRVGLTDKLRQPNRKIVKQRTHARVAPQVIMHDDPHL
jgi:hypothetical protein